MVFNQGVFYAIQLVKDQGRWGKRTDFDADRQALPARPQHQILLRLQRQQVSRFNVG